jgi:hypothetical protein
MIKCDTKVANVVHNVTYLSSQNYLLCSPSTDNWPDFIKTRISRGKKLAGKNLKFARKILPRENAARCNEWKTFFVGSLNSIAEKKISLQWANAKQGDQIGRIFAYGLFICFLRAGTDFMIFYIFSLKNRRKMGVFDSKQSYIMLKCDHYIGVWEKRQFLAENCRKSQKIVIIISTPGLLKFRK